MRALLILAAAWGLAACDGLPAGVFRADRESPLLAMPPLNDAAPNGVWIAPIDAPAIVGEVGPEPFRRALARALVRREIAAGVDSVRPESLRLIATVGPATAAGKGYVDVDWRLEDANGRIGDPYAVAVPLDFRVERPETVAAVNRVANWMARTLGQPPETGAAARIVVAVPPAQTDGFDDGAPLARAMAAALGARGFQPGAREEAAAIVQAAARIAPIDGRKDLVAVAIRWTVAAPDGRVVGVAEQENALPKKLAADGLAAIAADAAAAAVDSVAGLIRLAADSPPEPPSTGGGRAKGDG